MDQSIQSTSDDAIRAKEAAVVTGYYQDPFVRVFYNNVDVPSFTNNNNSNNNNNHHLHPSRAGGGAGRGHIPVQPIIKRGTHARVACVDRALVSYLNYVNTTTTDTNNNTNSNENTNGSGEERTMAKREAQIVVLGCGKDTTFFRLQAGLLLEREVLPCGETTTSTNTSIRWFEVDHENIVTEKANTIIESSDQRRRSIFGQNIVVTRDPTSRCITFEQKSNDESRCTTPSVQNDKDEDGNNGVGTSSDHNAPLVTWRQGSTYHLIAHDLRQDTQQLLQKLTSCGFNNKVPTLFICECVLMYLPETTSQELVHDVANFTSPSTPSFLVMYEPILGNHDAFGEMMEKNLIKAGMADTSFALIQTRTLQQQLAKLTTGYDNYKTTTATSARAASTAFTIATGCDMWTAYETVVRPEQRRIANACEFLDELEEWIILLRHYCLVVAVKVPSTSSSSSTSLSSDAKRFCCIGKASPMGFVNGRCQSMSNDS